MMVEYSRNIVKNASLFSSSSYFVDIKPHRGEIFVAPGVNPGKKDKP